MMFNNMTETAMLRDALEQRNDHIAELENKHQGDCQQIAKYQDADSKAVHIVRCKDCAYYNPYGCAVGNGWCELFGHDTTDNYCFCCWAERR